MDDIDFKKKFKFPACTQVPWKNLIPREEREAVLRQVRQEVIDAYGHTLDECPKRKLCWTKNCMGRPLEWKSASALPYLKKFAAIVGIQEGEDYFVKDCGGCPIRTTCSSPCYQINDFINRDKVKEPQIYYKDSIDNLDSSETTLTDKTVDYFNTFSIPWDSLNKRKSDTVKKYLYEQRDFKYVADSLGLTNQAAAKYEFYSALNKLSEFGIMRRFLIANQEKLTENQKKILNEVYFNNTSLTNTAKKLNITKQAVSIAISRVIKLNKIKWHVFVKKSGNKVIYNLMEVIN